MSSSARAVSESAARAGTAQAQSAATRRAARGSELLAMRGAYITRREISSVPPPPPDLPRADAGEEAGITAPPPDLGSLSRSAALAAWSLPGGLGPLLLAEGAELLVGLAEEEAVLGQLSADAGGGGGAVVVAGVDAGLLGEGGQTLQAAPHGGGVASGEVGTAAAPDEHDVPGDVVAVGEVAGAAHGVAEGLEGADAALADGDVQAIPDVQARLRLGGQRLLLVGVDDDGGMGLGHHLIDAFDVIVVRVGDQNLADSNVQAARLAQQGVHLPGGVDHRGLAGLGAVEDLAEVLRHPHLDLEDLGRGREVAPVVAHLPVLKVTRAKPMLSAESKARTV